MKSNEPKFKKHKASNSSDSFSKNYKKFRKNKLGIFDSFYAAFYIAICSKNENKEKSDGKESLFIRFFTVAPYAIRKVFGSFYSFFRSFLYNDGGTKKYKRKRDFIKANYPILIAFSLFAAGLIYVAVYLSKPIVLYANLDGEQIAVVSSESDMNAAIDELEKNVSVILGTNFNFPYKISYTFKKEWNPVLTDKTAITTNLYPYLRDYITTASGLYIDGKLAAVCENGNEIRNLLNSLVAEKFAQTQDETTDFYNEVTVVDQAYPTKSIITIEKLSELLKDMMIPPQKRNNAAKKTELIENSDDVKQKLIVDGIVSDLDFINKPKKAVSNVPQDTSSIYLRFCTSKELNYSEEIPFTTSYVESSQHYTSMVDITQFGENGKRTVNATVYYDNGVEISRKVNTEIIEKEPVNQVVSIGIKKLPEDMGVTGYKNRFILPHIGEISSRFGYREDGMHYGWDMPGKEGEPVYAGASGIVATAIGPKYRETVFEGQSYSGYGYVVVIAHGDEYYTLYAHMSDICVKVGQEIKQGEKIGEIGNTGISEGNHVHYELMKGKKKLDVGNGYLYAGDTTIYSK